MQSSNNPFSENETELYVVDVSHASLFVHEGFKSGRWPIEDKIKKIVFNTVDFNVKGDIKNKNILVRVATTAGNNPEIEFYYFKWDENSASTELNKFKYDGNSVKHELNSLLGSQPTGYRDTSTVRKISATPMSDAFFTACELSKKYIKLDDLITTLPEAAGNKDLISNINEIKLFEQAQLVDAAERNVTEFIELVNKAYKESDETIKSIEHLKKQLPSQPFIDSESQESNTPNKPPQSDLEDIPELNIFPNTSSDEETELESGSTSTGSNSDDPKLIVAKIKDAVHSDGEQDAAPPIKEEPAIEENHLSPEPEELTSTPVSDQVITPPPAPQTQQVQVDLDNKSSPKPEELTPPLVNESGKTQLKRSFSDTEFELKKGDERKEGQLEDALKINQEFHLAIAAMQRIIAWGIKHLEEEDKILKKMPQSEINDLKNVSKISENNVTICHKYAVLKHMQSQITPLKDGTRFNSATALSNLQASLENKNYQIILNKRRTDGRHWFANILVGFGDFLENVFKSIIKQDLSVFSDPANKTKSRGGEVLSQLNSSLNKMGFFKPSETLSDKPPQDKNELNSADQHKKNLTQEI